MQWIVRCALWLCLPWALLACQDAPEPQTQGSAAAEMPVDVSTVVERTIQVTLNQGTNLGLTVDPASSDRVISLQGTLFLLPADGSGAIALTDAYYDAREPQFSADGQLVVFQGYRGGNWDIFTVGRDGAPPVAVTSDPFDDREPQFSADGSAIVFSSDRNGRYNVWSIELASGALTQHTDSGVNAFAPAWSTQGRLAYAETSGRNALLKATGGEGGEADIKTLVDHAGVISGVQWSPDGTQIAYHLLDAQGAQLNVLNVASGQVDTWSQAGADVFPFKPAWLNDGQLSYTADGEIFTRNQGQDREAWPFSVDLTLTRHDYPRRQRDYDPTKERQAMGISSPQVSNDGTRIYFSALGDLWRWQPSLNQLEQLTDDPFAENSPTLAPDGRSLAFVSDTQGELDLRLMDLASGEVSSFGVGAQSISYPTFSPSGGEIAFFVDVPGNPLGGQLVVMDIATKDMQKVLSPMPAQPISFSADGTRVAVTRLNTYSSRYREGIYELLVVDLTDQTVNAISPVPHRSILNATLTPDGAMSYVQDGLLHRLELDGDYQPLEAAGQLTTELTDMPSWSANAEYVVYLSGNRLQRLHTSSGALDTITPELPYRLATSQERYIVRAGRVFTGLEDDYLEHQDIWINGNQIESIAPATPGQDHGLTVVDASEKTVVPGLFEMHAHMGENSETQGRVWLSYGITTVRDPGSNPYIAKERQEAWDSGRRIGPRTHITGYLTDGNRVYYSMAEGIASEAHLQRALDRTAQLELDFIKTYVRLPDHYQKQVVDFAHELGIPVSSHELYPAVAHGMDHVEHIGGTSRRGYQPKVSRLGYSYDDVVTLLAASGMGMTATAVLPGFAVIVSEEPDWFETPQFETFYGAQARKAYEYMLTRFGAGAAATAKANGKLLRELTERNALLVTGTDSPFVPYGAGLHAELRLYQRAGVPNADILRQATIRSAQAAGVAEELGTLEVGKLADMVIVSGDPLKNIGDLDQVEVTIKNGQRYALAELLEQTVH